MTIGRFLTPNEQKEVEKDIPISLRDYYEGLEHPRLYILEEGSYGTAKELDFCQETFFENDLRNRGISWVDKNITYIIVDDDTVGDDPEDILDYVIRSTKFDRFLTPNEQKEVEKDIPIRLRDYYEGLEHPRLYIVEAGSYAAKELEDAYQAHFFTNRGISWVDKNIAYIIVDDDTVGDDPEDILDYIRFKKPDRFLTPNEQKEVEKYIPIRLRDYYEGLEHPRLYIVEAGSYAAKELEDPYLWLIELMNEGISWVDKNIKYIIVDDDTVGDDPEDILDYMFHLTKPDRFLTPNEQKEVEKYIPIRLRDYYEGLEHPRLYIVEAGSYGTAKELEHPPFFEIELMNEDISSVDKNIKYNKGIYWVDKNIAYIIVDDPVGYDREDIPEYIFQEYMFYLTKLDRFLTPNEQKEVEKDIPIFLRDYYEGLEHPRLYILEEGSYTAKRLEDAYQVAVFEFPFMIIDRAWVDKDIAYIIVDDDAVGDDPEYNILDYMIPLIKLDRFLTPNEQKEVEKDIPISLRDYYEGLEHPRLYILEAGSYTAFMHGRKAWVDKNIAYIIVDDDTVGDDPEDILDYMIHSTKLDRFLTPNEQKEVEKYIPFWFLRNYYEGLEHPRLYIVEAGSYTAFMHGRKAWFMHGRKAWVDKNIAYIIVDDDTVGDDPEDILNYMIH